MTQTSPQISSEGFIEKLSADAKNYCHNLTLRQKILTPFRLFFFTPGFQLSFSIRLQELLRSLPLIGKPLRWIIWYATSIYFGSDIGPLLTLGSGVHFPHPYGIVIGSKTVIGRNVRINQNVTIGRPNAEAENDYPVIHDGVQIHSGAVIVGAITIGKNAKIGANSVVVKDVPENATAFGVPARNIMPTSTDATTQS